MKNNQSWPTTAPLCLNLKKGSIPRLPSNAIDGGKWRSQLAYGIIFRLAP
jgi:hypothetical protein